ncbi:hypothetical protein Glove_645g53 [Diversispora epigaea]|uniref:Uncharacterized protein n=1 Tax=Diversispora epigaea TaxID=1348612 RepID=A0A397G7P4_9GLOM|nr:hypothetical protein Glove_645g53 [Diversispora epigaea]
MDTQAKSNKVLTPEYLDWYSKITDLPTTISDKLRSKLYKIYKKKTGLDPWIKSENSESPQIEKTDNFILQDSSLETQVTISQVNVQSKRQFSIFVLPEDPEERQQHVINLVLERFPYLTLKYSFKNNYFDFNRSVLCPLCDKNHKKENIRNYIEGF